MEEKIHTIYMHKNKINNKVYIGQTCLKNVERRWKNGCGYDKCPRFYHAICKYGWENFEHIILETNISKKDINERERYWIQQYYANEEKYGYNLTSGGMNYMKEKWQDEDYRKQMHESFSKSRKKKVENGTFQKDYLEPMLRGIQRVWNDPEWRTKRINNIIGDKNPNSKQVRNLETGKIFNTIKEAAEWMHMKSVSGIGQCCKGQRKTCGKHPETGIPMHWEYVRKEGLNYESI